MMVRTALIRAVKIALARSQVVVLYGPRQSGKTTLARELLSEDSVNYFDLEDPVDTVRLDQPMTALRPLTGLVVIDEIQRKPEIFPMLRVLADRRKAQATFLILGSASGELLQQSSESLAGRTEHIAVSGFTLAELGAGALQTLWLRGGFPRAYLAGSEADSLSWRKHFVQTLLERDFPQWGVQVSAIALYRFWGLLAHYHGQTWNAAAPARVLGVSESTTRRYLDLLTDALMIRQLQPYYVNSRKRQVKSPKIYLRDSGLLHQFLGIETLKQLLTHPTVGSSWEGFVIEQILAIVPHDEAYFWATHQGAEIDLVLRQGSERIGIECKRTDSPRLTRSIRIALTDLGLSRVVVIYPGIKRFKLAENVDVVPLTSLAKGDL